MSEKQKHHPKSAPAPKKTPEKKAIHEKKQEVLKAKKDCRVETRKELTKVNLDTLKNQVWHTVKPGENIWRIIYNHAQENGKTPIKAEKLQDVNITIWDKVFFTKDEVIIKYMKWGSKRVSIENTQECKPEEKKWENKKTPEKPTEVKKHQEQKDTPKVTEQKSSNDVHKKRGEEPKKSDEKQKKEAFNPSIDTLDLTLWVMNEKQLEKEAKAKAQKETTKPQDIKEDNKPSLTIFDPESPLKWDQIAYKHEVEIKKAYGKAIKELVAKYCKWSIIDEDFLYWVIARESRFNKNAKSHTGVKWLWQITNGTLKTLVNIHEAKLKNNPDMSELYITKEITKWNTKDKKWFYTIDDKEALKPINQIKLSISYLMYLEDLFREVKNEKFKSDLIITSYNLWAGKTKEIFETYRWVKNREWLKQAIERAQERWEVSAAKAKEVKIYTQAVKENIQKSKDIKLASL